MMSIKTKTFVSSVQSARCFSVWFPLNQKSHYETLGVGKGSTPAEIKSAFYKLSKKHHPDANVNDPTATAKFQEIVEAYEVLGNEDAKKRYDVGMRPGDGSISRAGFKTPDDPRAAFYKSRLANKMNSPMAGRTYNFDEWTKEHYSDSIKTNRAMNSQSFSRDTSVRRTSSKSPLQGVEGRIAFVLLAVIVISMVTLHLDNPDSPKPK